MLINLDFLIFSREKRGSLTLKKRDGSQKIYL